MASERDGLTKLTDYLNQTRRQATAAIDVLNEKIDEMRIENETCMNIITKLEKERDYYRDNYEQVKVENSTKWKLRERDEWKSLVENVQQDRNRLQESINQLELDLEESRHYSTVLKSDLDKVLVDNARLQDLLKIAEEKENHAQTSASINSIEETPSLSSRKRDLWIRADAESMESVPFSPYIDLNGNELTFNSQTPTSINRQLKSELRKTQVEMEKERQEADQKLDLYAQEIDRLSKLKDVEPHSVFEKANSSGLENETPISIPQSYSWFGAFNVLNFFSGSNSSVSIDAKAIKV